MKILEELEYILSNQSLLCGMNAINYGIINEEYNL